MSSINTNAGLPDPTLNPLDPTSTSTTTSNTSPTSNAYYASGISSASSSETGQPSAADSSAPVLGNPRTSKVSISDFIGRMTKVNNTIQEKDQEIAQDYINSIKNYHNAILLNVLGLKDLLRWGELVANANLALQAEYNAQLDSLNAQIAAFNSGVLTDADKAALDQINAAITAYNEAKAIYTTAQADFAAGNITQADLDAATAAFTAAQTAYNTAVTTYNDYGKARYDSLKSLIDNFNTNTVATFSTQTEMLRKMIKEYNALAAPAGLPPVSQPKAPGAPKIEKYEWSLLEESPKTDPVPLVARPNPIPIYSMQPIGNIQAQAEAIQQKINASIDELYAALKNFMTQINANNASVEYYMYREKIKDNEGNPGINPEAVVPASNQVLRAGSSSGTPSGVDFLNLTGRLINPSVASLLKQAQENNLHNKQSIADLDAKDQLTLMMSQFLISAGVLGGNTAVGVLGNNLSKVPPDGNAAKIAAVLGFVKELQKLAGTDIYKNTVDQIAQANQLPANDPLSENAVSNIELSGALMSLFQAARALGSPQLVRQMILAAGGDTIPELKAVLDKPPTGILVDTLADPTSKQQLKDSLTEQLVREAGMGETDARKMTEKAVDNVAAKGSRLKETDLEAAITSEFRQQPLDAKIASSLAKTAIDVLRDEQNRPELNFLFNKQNLDKAILQDPLFTDPAITKAVNNVLLTGDSIHSQRQFRTELVQELLLTGMKQPEALRNANAVLDALSGVSESTRSTRKEVPPLLVNEETLKNSTSKEIIKELQKELGVVPSHEIARDLTAALFGNDRASVINVIRESIRSTEKLEAKEERERLADKIAIYLLPDVELFAFAQALMDPANNVIFSASTGLMYQGLEPSNFRKSIDIPM